MSKRRNPQGSPAVFLGNLKTDTPYGALCRNIAHLFRFIGIEVKRRDVTVRSKTYAVHGFVYVSDEATLQFALKQLNDSALISQYGKMQDIVEDGLILIVNRKRGGKENLPGSTTIDTAMEYDSANDSMDSTDPHYHDPQPGYNNVEDYTALTASKNNRQNPQRPKRDSHENRNSGLDNIDDYEALATRQKLNKGQSGAVLTSRNNRSVLGNGSQYDNIDDYASLSAKHYSSGERKHMHSNSLQYWDENQGQSSVGNFNQSQPVYFSNFNGNPVSGPQTELSMNRNGNPVSDPEPQVMSNLNGNPVPKQNQVLMNRNGNPVSDPELQVKSNLNGNPVPRQNRVLMNTNGNPVSDPELQVMSNLNGNPVPKQNRVLMNKNGNPVSDPEPQVISNLNGNPVPKQNRVLMNRNGNPVSDPEPQVMSNLNRNPVPNQNQPLMNRNLNGNPVFVKPKVQQNFNGNPSNNPQPQLFFDNVNGNPQQNKINTRNAISDSVLKNGTKTDAKVKKYIQGAFLGTENRNVEYKAGSGDYWKKHLRNHVNIYLTAFLNSDGGMMLIGVNDKGVVCGLALSQAKEDAVRLKIDDAVNGIRPEVFPRMYSVLFVPVMVLTEPIANLHEELKVIEIKIQKGTASELYQNSKGEAYIRRDGSVHGPLSASAIQEHTKQCLAEEGRRREHEITQLRSKENQLLEEQRQLQQNLLQFKVQNGETENQRTKEEKDDLVEELRKTKAQQEESLKVLASQLEEMKLQQEEQRRQRSETERQLTGLEQEKHEWVVKSRAVRSKTCTIL